MIIIVNIALRSCVQNILCVKLKAIIYSSNVHLRNVLMCPQCADITSVDACRNRIVRL